MLDLVEEPLFDAFKGSYSTITFGAWSPVRATVSQCLALSSACYPPLHCYRGQCENIHDDGSMGHHQAIGATIEPGELKMNITRTLCIASILALSIAAPVQAQTAKGDYYAPGAATPLHATAGQELKIKDGDYYFGDTMILNHARAAALKQCTEGHHFAGDHYVACMAKLGEAP